MRPEALFLRCLAVLLSVDRLEHRGDLFHAGSGHEPEYISIPMNHAALPLCLGKNLCHRLDQPEAFVRYDLTPGNGKISLIWLFPGKIRASSGSESLAGALRFFPS